MCFCHGLKMCIWFWCCSPIIILSTFSTFLTLFFAGQITIRIDTLWMQLLLFLHFRLNFFPCPICIRIDIWWVQLPLDFSTDHLETMHTCSTWSEDEHVVLGFSCHYLFSTFCTLSTLFFFRCDTMMWVACGGNSSYSLYKTF